MYSKVKLHFVRKDFYDYRNRGECITSDNTESTFFNYSFIAYRCNKCNRVVDHINIRFLFEKKIRDNFLYDFFTKISLPQIKENKKNSKKHYWNNIEVNLIGQEKIVSIVLYTLSLVFFICLYQEYKVAENDNRYSIIKDGG